MCGGGGGEVIFGSVGGGCGLNFFLAVWKEEERRYLFVSAESRFFFQDAFILGTRVGVREIKAGVGPPGAGWGKSDPFRAWGGVKVTPSGQKTKIENRPCLVLKRAGGSRNEKCKSPPRRRP